MDCATLHYVVMVFYTVAIVAIREGSGVAGSEGSAKRGKGRG